MTLKTIVINVSDKMEQLLYNIQNTDIVMITVQVKQIKIIN